LANSKQQRKRVRTAERERLENRRYRSGIKTMFRRLTEARENGESAESVETAHRRLVRFLDLAAARKAIHRNAAARKKSQAAKIAQGDRQSA
jgi:small subunit ribosomal protein S20